MRKTLKTTLIVFMALGLTAGKKPKNEEAPAPEPAPAPAAPAAGEDEMAEPEEETEASSQDMTPNADFNAKVTFANGSTASGHVIRVERSEDWYAEEGWTDKASKLTVTVEGNGTEKDVEWKAIKAVDVSYLGKSNITCDYDSNYTPLMWTCTMSTTSKVQLAEGGSWSAASRHKWKFVFDDGKTAEFWINKIASRRQEDPSTASNAAEAGTLVDPDFQVSLQNEVTEMSNTIAAKRIEITAP